MKDSICCTIVPPVGNLHCGNIVLSNETAKIISLTGLVCGQSSRLRSLAVRVKAVKTVDSVDVYSFGHLLYEISVGRPLDTTVCDEFPPQLPDIISTLFIFT